MKKLLPSLAAFTWAMTTACENAFAQDPQFSQYYANQVWLSPAFTGAHEHMRVAMNFRAQWPGVGADFYKTFATSFDTPLNIGPTHHGIGATIAVDQAGRGNLTKVDFLANYAYSFFLPGDRSAIRLGLAFGLQQASIDYSKLKFPDQFQADGSTILSRTGENLNQSEARVNEEIGVGALYYSNWMWAGVDLRHLTMPRQIFLRPEFGGNAAVLPLRLSAYTGFRFPLVRNDYSKTISPSLMFRWQRPFVQVDFMTYMTWEPIVFGLGYRVLSGGAGPGDAVIGLIGFHRGMFRFGYSYDFTISNLTVGASGGSHEVSLIVEIERQGRKRSPKVKMSCPKF